jgi:hypothetical protein
MLSVETRLARNTGSNRLLIPYFAQVTCHGLANTGPEFAIPVRTQFDGRKKILSVELVGLRMTTDQLSALPALVARLFESMAYNGHLPDYVFIARDAGTVLPVYTINREVIAPARNGPIFRHLELSVVREQLTDYLHSVKVLGTGGAEDKLHVRGVDPESLQLVRPRFYLKKRVAGQTGFWAPVFRSGDGQTLHTWAANGRRSAPASADTAILALQQIVARALLADHRLANSHDLRPDRLFPDDWDRLRSRLTPVGGITVYGVGLPLYRAADGTMIALEKRPEEDRYSLYLGSDQEDVQARAERDFARRGIGF